MQLRPPISTLFPYTTLFRSRQPGGGVTMPQRRVLIVDDALFMRNTLRDIFAGAGFAVAGEADDGVQAVNLRSEEHTSELQSLTNLVCRLLLEKKKKITSN